jgi:hypothetical protein
MARMSSEQFEAARIRAFIRGTIRKFDLDLRGLKVFTEAASGVYRYTPLIAALAGAEKVFAVAADSRYGNKEKIRQDIDREALALGVSDKVNVVFEKLGEGLRESDVITNSGFVRPINAEMIGMMKGSAVIPLMWEAWELRPDEVDVAACRSRGILVMGTNEHHPSLNLFRSIGFKVCKLLFSAGYSVYSDKFLLVSSGDYGNSIADFLARTSVSHDRIDLAGYSSSPEGEWMRRYGGFLRKLGDYDAVIIAELDHDIRVVAEDGVIPPSLLKSENPLARIIYICGVVDKDEIVGQELEMYPEAAGEFRHIAVTADYLGWKPVLELNTAGLKVGEAMARARLSGLSPNEAVAVAMRDSPADVLASLGT